MEKMTFEEIPSCLQTMMEKIEEIMVKLDKLDQFKSTTTRDVWLSVKALSEYIPTHPASPTIYGWTHNKIIPYHKKGKSLLFLKSEIDNWLDSGKVASKSELNDAALEFVRMKNDELMRKKLFG